MFVINYITSSNKQFQFLYKNMQAPSCLSANTQLLTHHSKKNTKKTQKTKKEKSVKERERLFREKRNSPSSTTCFI